jgi:hypothetical protein
MGLPFRNCLLRRRDGGSRFAGKSTRVGQGARRGLAFDA